MEFLDKEINFILKEEPLWMKAKLSTKEKIDVAELLQRYVKQLKISDASSSDIRSACGANKNCSECAHYHFGLNTCTHPNKNEFERTQSIFYFLQRVK